jgi:hypothetical protein
MRVRLSGIVLVLGIAVVGGILHGVFPGANVRRNLPDDVS